MNNGGGSLLQKIMQRRGDTSQRQGILNFHAFSSSLSVSLFLNFEFSSTYDRLLAKFGFVVLVFLLGYEMMMQCAAIAPCDEKRGIVVQNV